MRSLILIIHNDGFGRLTEVIDALTHTFEAD